jgi:hypothetical protein
LAFLGVPSEYINEGLLSSLLPQNLEQFANPNTINWTLNFSSAFYSFPENVSSLLRQNSFVLGNSAYFNATLLDDLLTQFEDLAIPERGYLLTFMWIPNATGHSWFYVQDRPDLFLNRTDYFNGVPSEYWVFPPNFGGLRRAMYFDISDVMKASPSETLMTETVATRIKNSLSDIFTDLGGSVDPRMIAADIQTYGDYSVRILWLNGTGEQPPLEQIQESFQDLMPWTNWTVTLQTKPADSELNAFIKSMTTELSTPINYTAVLSNGSSSTIEAIRSVEWNPYEDSGEYDPVNQYFFNHVRDYFGLTDLEDKSVIPVVLLQLDNDTAFGGAYQGGVSWFLHNTIVVAFQGSALTGLGESGPLLLVHLLRHEIGHWVSLIHHTSVSGSDHPKVICSMRSLTNEFCAFCKDARARMSFISYYNATLGLLSKDQSEAAAIEKELNTSLQSFYDWDYVKAVDTISSIYFSLDNTPPNIIGVLQTPGADSVLPSDEVYVSATVTDDLSGVKNVILKYTNYEGAWIAIDMTNIEGNIWNATIPAFPYGTNVTYTIMAEDNFNNAITSQEIGFEYSYRVIPEFSFFVLLILIAATLMLILTGKIRRLVFQKRAGTR